MSSSSRKPARERIAAQRAAQQRAERRRNLLLGGGIVVVVLAIVVVIVVIKINKSTPAPPSTPPAGTLLPASVASQVTNVPAATLAAVGAGSSLSYNAKSIVPASGPPLAKPGVLYVGAEFCPFCATERWAMTVALSRFGTFSPLHGIHSAPSPEVYPSTATLTYYRGSYTSKYLTFTSVETEKVDHSPLQTLTSQQSSLLEKYTQGSIPFVYFNGKYALTSVSYDPQVLAGKSWSQIASALSDASNPIAQGVDGSANLITAAICKVTTGQPASVCATPLITGLQSKL